MALLSPPIRLHGAIHLCLIDCLRSRQELFGFSESLIISPFRWFSRKSYFSILTITLLSSTESFGRFSIISFKSGAFPAQKTIYRRDLQDLHRFFLFLFTMFIPVNPGPYHWLNPLSRAQAYDLPLEMAASPISWGEVLIIFAEFRSKKRWQC